MTLDDDINGCNGVPPNDGSENTTKRFDPDYPRRFDPDYPSNFNPGGVVGYIIDHPVTASDVSGRTTFVITDCVFVNGIAVARFKLGLVAVGGEDLGGSHGLVAR